MSEWRIVPGFPCYEVSSDGQVRCIVISKGMRGRRLKPWLAAGYYKVGLFRDGRATRAFIHRLVCAAFNGDPKGRYVDHIDGNPLNNCASNLRWAAAPENTANSRQLRDGYRGISRVSRKKGARVWRAYGSKNRKTVFLGSFETEVEAARAYDRWAGAQYGKFARLNFPEGAA